MKLLLSNICFTLLDFSKAVLMMGFNSVHAYCFPCTFFSLFRFSTICAMGLNRRIRKANTDVNNQELTISLHSFSDLSHVSPVVFLYLLKECYIHGTIISLFARFWEVLHISFHARTVLYVLLSLSHELVE